MSRKREVRSQMLEWIRIVARALDTEVLNRLDDDTRQHIDANLIDALTRAQTELERVELQLEAELREGPRDLTCVECSVVSAGDTTHWKAYLTSDDEVAIYCPDCCLAFEVGRDR